MKKFLVLTKKNRFGKYEARRVAEEAEKVGLGVETIYYDDLWLRFEKEELMVFDDDQLIDFEEFGWCYSRSSAIRPKVRLTELKRVLDDELIERGVRLLNGKSLTKDLVLSKLEQQYQLLKAGLGVIDGDYLGVGPMRENVLGLPLVAKGLTGSMGATVGLIKSGEEVGEILKDGKGHKFLWQKLIENEGDLRVLVLDGRVLGAIERRAKDGEFLNNVSAGGTAVMIKIEDEVGKMALKACEVFGLDFCGVDLIKDKEGKWYVLEVNRHPQFEGFEKVTEINVASEIVGFLVGGVMPS